jgi:hypothetical protein
MSTNNKTSVLIESQLPEYLAEDGPNLVAFLKAYYQWMETSGQVTEVSKNIFNSKDIDTTNLSKYYLHFRSMLLQDFPEEIRADKRLVTKRIIDLYQSKGTDLSYNLLFRILYGQDVQLFNPGEYILRASDGRWTKRTNIQLGAPFSGNIENIVGKVVTGQTSGAKGTVTTSVTTFEIGVEVKKLTVKDVTGTFLDFEQVLSDDNIGGFVVRLNGPLGDIKFGTVTASGGSGHQLGDTVRFTSSSGSGANGIVISTTDTPSPGTITRIRVQNQGSDYNANQPVTVSNLSRTGTTNASGDPVVVGAVTENGSYIGTKGFLSWDQKLHDSYYYQEYSYVIKSQKALKVYRDIVRDVLHPSGTRMFGQMDFSNNLDATGLSVESVFSSNLLRVVSISPNTVFGLTTVLAPEIDIADGIGPDTTIGSPSVLVVANGFIYIANNNIISSYLSTQISQLLSQPVIIGTAKVVQGDGGFDFTTFLNSGATVEIQDIIPGGTGNTTYIVNTVFSNTTFTLNTDFVGSTTSNAIFRYTS